jgi:phage repressor protein C with HTH and peptisase S24 domain
MDHRWLRAELEKPGRSQSALARFLGLEHPSIVNRMVAGQRTIKATEADRIRQYLSSTEDSTAAITHSGQVALQASSLPVRGIVEAGSWREVAYSDIATEELIAPKSIVDSGAYALKVAGPSMDLFYPDGSYVIVQPWHGGPLPIGKHVIVERERDGLRETTIKELCRAADGRLELWPRSSQPGHQTPLTYDEHDEATVRLIGRVIWMISPVR